MFIHQHDLGMRSAQIYKIMPMPQRKDLPAVELVSETTSQALQLKIFPKIFPKSSFLPRLQRRMLLQYNWERCLARCHHCKDVVMAIQNNLGNKKQEILTEKAGTGVLVWWLVHSKDDLMMILCTFPCKTIRVDGFHKIQWSIVEWFRMVLPQLLRILLAPHVAEIFSVNFATWWS